MEQLYPIFDDCAHQFYSLPMFPLLQCGHFTIVTLGLRKKIGLTFARTNPLACWMSTIVANLSGILLVNVLLSRPIIELFRDEKQLLIITGIWYLTFFCPKDAFCRVLRSRPFFTVIILLKEAHRAKGILGGVELGMLNYSDAILITVIFGFLKGAAGLLTEPLAAAIRGTLTIANNEALKPSYNSKISVCVSILYTLHHKGIITAAVPLPHLCLAVYIILAVVQVTLYWSGGRDPFIFIENTLSPYCFGSPSLEDDSSSQPKNKSKKD